MNREELTNLTAVCGIDCFNCEYFHSNIDAFFETMPAERKAVIAARGLTIENLRCRGCRNGGCTVIGGRCDTLECAREKKVDFCHECGQFPCGRLQPLADYAPVAPHNLKVYNLMAIRNRGIEAWAAETKEIRKKYFRGKFKIGAGPQIEE